MREVVKKITDDPWLLTILFGGLFLLGIAGFVVNMRISNREAKSPSSREEHGGTPRENPENGPKTTIVDEKEFRGPIIRYTKTGFLPKKISLTEKDAEVSECLIQIKNESTDELLPRLGPWSEKDNRGFAYNAISPNQSAIIDPRYSGIFSEEFYNRKNPSHTFSLSLSKLCFQ